MPKAKYSGTESILGKTVVITGANTGIGKETARDLARRGGRIILACRNVEKGEEARKEIVDATKNETVLVKELDLASFGSIRAFAKNLNETESRLDILINNAGIMMCPKLQTKDGLEMQMGTNHFGHFLLTNLLLDKLKDCSPSKIIILSSKAHINGRINFDDINSERSYSAVGAYCNSKLANILHALELTKRLQGTGVTVNSVHPGVVNTELARHSMLARIALAPFRRFLMKSSEEGAQTTLYCALNPHLEGVSAKYFADCKETAAHRRAQDEAVAKRLWEVSEEMTREK